MQAWLSSQAAASACGYTCTHRVRGQVDGKSGALDIKAVLLTVPIAVYLQVKSRGIMRIRPHPPDQQVVDKVWLARVHAMVDLTDAGAGKRQVALETRVTPLHPLALQVPNLSDQPAAVSASAAFRTVADSSSAERVGGGISISRRATRKETDPQRPNLKAKLPIKSPHPNSAVVQHFRNARRRRRTHARQAHRASLYSSTHPYQTRCAHGPGPGCRVGRRV